MIIRKRVINKSRKMNKKADTYCYKTIVRC